MYKLYHHTICPFSRKARMHLAAKNIEFELILENCHERRKEFVALNPVATTPVLVKGDLVVCFALVISEYIEEKYTDSRNMIGVTPEERAEARRIQYWFDNKFFHEVSKLILNERYFNRFLPSVNAPNSEILRMARQYLTTHFNYIEELLQNRKYLASNQISVADMAAAAQISVLDYFGDINWAHFPAVKDWYSLVKSHKFFTEILKDKLAGMNPPEWYANLDF